MPQVEFEDQGYRPQFTASRDSSLANMLVQRGVMKEKKRAHVFLVLFALVSFSGAIYFAFGPAIKQQIAPETVYREDIPAEVLNTLPEEVRESIPSRGE